MEQRIKGFLACEKSDYNDFLEREGRSLREQVQKIKAEQSPAVIGDDRINARIAKVMEEYVQKLINSRLELRRKYARQEAELLSDVMLRQLETDLTNIAQSNGKDFIDADASLQLDAFLKRGIGKLKLQRELGFTDELGEKIVNININNSTVAALNLGTVMGDMNATVATLQGQGDQKLAEAIRALTEAIAKDEKLGDNRRDAIEALSTIGEQAVLPPAERKTGVVKALLTSLASTLRVGADTAKVWDVFGANIASYFNIILPG